jgi:malate dehydrogenase
MRKKVTVVGGGFVGATTAQRIVDKELADVVLTDILDGFPCDRNFNREWRLQRDGE